MLGLLANKHRWAPGVWTVLRAGLSRAMRNAPVTASSFLVEAILEIELRTESREQWQRLWNRSARLRSGERMVRNALAWIVWASGKFPRRDGEKETPGQAVRRISLNMSLSRSRKGRRARVPNPARLAAKRELFSHVEGLLGLMRNKVTGKSAFQDKQPVPEKYSLKRIFSQPRIMEWIVRVYGRPIRFNTFVADKRRFYPRMSPLLETKAPSPATVGYRAGMAGRVLFMDGTGCTFPVRVRTAPNQYEQVYLYGFRDKASQRLWIFTSGSANESNVWPSMILKFAEREGWMPQVLVSDRVSNALEAFCRAKHGDLGRDVLEPAHALILATKTKISVTHPMAPKAKGDIESSFRWFKGELGAELQARATLEDDTTGRFIGKAHYFDSWDELNGFIADLERDHNALVCRQEAKGAALTRQQVFDAPECATWRKSRALSNSWQTRLHMVWNDLRITRYKGAREIPGLVGGATQPFYLPGTLPPVEDDMIASAIRFGLLDTDDPQKPLAVVIDKAAPGGAKLIFTDAEEVRRDPLTQEKLYQPLVGEYIGRPATVEERQLRERAAATRDARKKFKELRRAKGLEPEPRKIVNGDMEIGFVPEDHSDPFAEFREASGD